MYLEIVNEVGENCLK